MRHYCGVRRKSSIRQDALYFLHIRSHFNSAKILLTQEIDINFLLNTKIQYVLGKGDDLIEQCYCDGHNYEAFTL